MIAPKIARLAVIGVLALTLHLQAGDTVPFKGICYGDFSSAPPTLSGNGTHLGQFTGVLIPVGPGVLSVVLRAANGDEIWADVFPYPTGGGGVAVITGGTGRFEGATGSWTSTWIEPPPLLVERFEGEISTVGSNKR
ncbi:MAG: hypothetical protein KJ072_23865 [Verrucomicrobia bacterium]|nr:hypothetical protein [Verrucomicrobiota bacterium]